MRNAVDNGTIGTSELHTLNELVNRGPTETSGPVLLKTVGMGWQDLAVAQVAYRAES